MRKILLGNGDRGSRDHSWFILPSDFFLFFSPTLQIHFQPSVRRISRIDIYIWFNFMAKVDPSEMQEMIQCLKDLTLQLNYCWDIIEQDSSYFSTSEDQATST